MAKQDWSPRAQPQPLWPEFVDSYLRTALWASRDAEGLRYDQHWTLQDFSQEAVNEAVLDTNSFIERNREDLESVGNQWDHGNDFYLARNVQGAGFLERLNRRYGSEWARWERLSKAAWSYGPADVYVEADGKLHFWKWPAEYAGWMTLGPPS